MANDLQAAQNSGIEAILTLFAVNSREERSIITYKERIDDSIEGLKVIWTNFNRFNPFIH
jgi:hypothetical protein